MLAAGRGLPPSRGASARRSYHRPAANVSAEKNTKKPESEKTYIPSPDECGSPVGIVEQIFTHSVGDFADIHLRKPLARNKSLFPFKRILSLSKKLA